MSTPTIQGSKINEDVDEAEHYYRQHTNGQISDGKKAGCDLLENNQALKNLREETLIRLVN
uniref:Uncharacterized protein n=1 Tax=Romanomermis culicivorax TaxID=13658 RepID=A0A915I6F9_ROMCU